MVARMKFPVLLLGLTLFSGVCLAQTAPQPPTPAEPAEVAKPAPPAKAKESAKPAVKKEEPMGKIVGTELARPNGQFLGLSLADGKFKLTFYDKKKKPTKVDVTRALFRWANVHGPGDNRAILNPDGANSLVGVQFVRPPYVFKVFVSLLKGDGDEAQVVESYVVDFRA